MNGYRRRERAPGVAGNALRLLLHYPSSSTGLIDSIHSYQHGKNVGGIWRIRAAADKQSTWLRRHGGQAVGSWKKIAIVEGWYSPSRRKNMTLSVA